MSQVPRANRFSAYESLRIQKVKEQVVQSREKHIRLMLFDQY
jgi:hypothetical protein